jgi:hypothetical protein
VEVVGKNYNKENATDTYSTDAGKKSSCFSESNGFRNMVLGLRSKGNPGEAATGFFMVSKFQSNQVSIYSLSLYLILPDY